MTKNIKFNFEFSLKVFEGRNQKIIGSEIEPVQLASQEENCCDHDDCNNIITTVWSLIIQEGKPYIIKETVSSITAEWTDHFFSWEAFDCNHLPAGKGIWRE